MSGERTNQISDVMRDLAAWIAHACERPLPPEVAEKAKHHTLDTLAAMISGSRLRPGELGVAYVRAQRAQAEAEASIAGTALLASAELAAFANGMTAHADETDDSHAPSFTHPGCAVIPAALAMAEREGRPGIELLRAVVLGYELCARSTMSLGRDALYAAGHSTHAFGGLFGAAAAAGALAGLDVPRSRWLLSYAAQQAAGITSWARDEEHIEKAFHFGAMPASRGVLAASLVAFGFSGVDDVFSGPRNFFEAFSAGPIRSRIRRCSRAISAAATRSFMPTSRSGRSARRSRRRSTPPSGSALSTGSSPRRSRASGCGCPTSRRTSSTTARCRTSTRSTWWP